MARNWMLTLALAVGCNLEDPNPDDGGQFGEEVTSSCQVVSRTPLALDEVSALGFAAQDVLALAEGTHTATLTWARDGAATGVTVTVALDGEAELLDREVVKTGTGSGEEPAITMWCPDMVEIGVAFTVTTDDGQLAESWSGGLTSEDGASASARRSLDAVQGTFDAWDHVDPTADYDELEGSLELGFDVQGSWGTVRAQGSGTDGEVAWAENLELGRWAPPGAEE